MLLGLPFPMGLPFPIFGKLKPPFFAPEKFIVRPLMFKEGGPAVGSEPFGACMTENADHTVGASSSTSTPRATAGVRKVVGRCKGSFRRASVSTRAATRHKPTTTGV